MSKFVIRGSKPETEVEAYLTTEGGNITLNVGNACVFTLKANGAGYLHEAVSIEPSLRYVGHSERIQIDSSI